MIHSIGCKIVGVTFVGVTFVGRLEVKEESYQKLYETAGLLRMSVLTKLMDAQVAWLAYTVFAHPDPRFAILEPPSEC